MAVVRQRPGLALYLAALALFPFKWFSPFGHQQAGWIDVLIAAATAVWILEWLRRGAPIRLRPPHYAYAAYLAAGIASAALASAQLRVGAENVLIMAELVALALLTSHYARDREGKRAIVRVILLVSFVAAAEGALGLLLFYLGDSTSLVSGSGSYFKQSDLYTRVAAGFYSAPLLGSFCIFASAMLAMEDTGLSPRLRRAGQIALAVLVLATLSRAVIGFAAAIGIRAAARRGTLKARRLAVVMLIAAAALVVTLSLVPLSADPLRPASSREDINPRLAFIKTSAQTLLDHPLLGAGPGSLTATWQGHAFRAHSTPLNVAVTMGPAALAALIALVVILWRQRRRPTNVAIWSGLAGLGLDAAGQDAEHFRHVWVMLGMADSDRAGPETPGDSAPAPRGSTSAARPAEP